MDTDGVSEQRTTVTAFKLDAFEVTVGRLRAFFDAMNGDLRSHAPAEGAGAHGLVPNSGWRKSFDVRLPGSFVEIDERLTTGCVDDGDDSIASAATWTPSPGANEEKPANCVDWYTIFAFCIWDGGRLPTSAEWSYVAASGSEARVFPFGDTSPTWTDLHEAIASNLTDPSRSGYAFTEGTAAAQPNDGPLHIARVGSKTERSKWGHADLTGNVLELTLDRARTLTPTCDDCADVAWPDPPQGVVAQPSAWFDADGVRVARGSSWQGEAKGHRLANGGNRVWQAVSRTSNTVGARCAR